MRCTSQMKALIGVLILAASGGVAPADDDFYKGKTLSVMIGSNPGGGYDLYGRLLARHLDKYVPGAPAVVPRNMPGAGGMRLMNYVYNVAPQDGTVVFTMHDNLPLLQRLNAPGVQYDVRRIKSIGRLSAGNELLLADPKSGFSSYTDLFQRELVAGDTGGGTVAMALPVLRQMGMKFRIISGYQGTAEIRLAMERGEVGGMGITLASMYASAPDMLKPGVIVPLVQIGSRREKEWSEAPTAAEVATSPEYKAALEVLSVGPDIGRSYWLGPGVADQPVEILRRAFDAMVKDPDLLREGEQQKLVLRFASGEQMTGYMKPVFEASEAALQILRLAIVTSK